MNSVSKAPSAINDEEPAPNVTILQVIGSILASFLWRAELQKSQARFSAWQGQNLYHCRHSDDWGLVSDNIPNSHPSAARGEVGLVQ